MKLQNQNLENLFSTEAEKGIIGAIFLEPEIFDDVIEKITHKDFFHPQHIEIFKTFEVLYDYGMPLDTITVMDQLKKRKIFEKVGGENYIIELASYVPNLISTNHYIKIIKEFSEKRKLLNLSKKIIEMVADNSIEIGKVKDYVEKVIIDTEDVGKILRFDEVLPQILSELNETRNLRKQGKSNIEITTGFKNLDNMLNGLHKGELTIIAARPAMGKTAFVLNMIENQIKKDISVIFFSLEMSKDPLVKRTISSLSGIDSQKIREGKITDKEWERILYYTQNILNKDFYIDDTPNLTPRLLRSHARKAKRKYDIEVLYVDYLQLINSNSKYFNKAVEVGEISRALKLIARELNIAVVALAQLSRAVEQRDNKRPQLADLRDSGAIEQDADNVLFLYRDNYYKMQELAKKKEKAKTEEEKLRYENEISALQNPHEVEILIAKQRNGPVGVKKVMFDPKITKFYEILREEEI
ncbi:replicative DNA helicase [Marinitoga hydrogenitolerans DSM 16785]|uniref:Replicative DNA helicase n=1 Tax=Marinitoga hydrogenitolerans (strain DSM 16785 / JCM 12826 / AT1271) TaxID=1122195 RepID=A0A1M4TSI5_MARH1|nr:replicative DNA helicase [Marinitoga hydrogenitolerans]SHE47378.1 replicative DNA helicase [Marinitoga hydrogenitolerans DSM 16785]